MGAKRKTTSGTKKDRKAKTRKTKVVSNTKPTTDVVEVPKRIVSYVPADASPEEFKNVWVCSSEKKYANRASRLPDPNSFGPFGNEMFRHMMSQAADSMPNRSVFEKAGVLARVSAPTTAGPINDLSSFSSHSTPVLYLSADGTQISPVPFPTGSKNKRKSIKKSQSGPQKKPTKLSKKKITSHAKKSKK